MRRVLLLIVLLCALCAYGAPENSVSASTEDVILDIFNAVTEISEVDFEQLQTDLYALHANPIDLNHTSDEELSQLYFLSPQQIDEILAYADKHPFESLYELRLIRSLTDFDIRNLLPFVMISPSRDRDKNKLYARDVFADAKHDMTVRIDARDLENSKTADPVFAQMRYRFDYRRRVIFGGQVRRPVYR